MNPFDQLSLLALEFFLERTDFSEGFCGFGFATEIEKELKAARERKYDKAKAVLQKTDV